jgi:hypothetical protein
VRLAEARDAIETLLPPESAAYTVFDGPKGYTVRLTSGGRAMEFERLTQVKAWLRKAKKGAAA